MTKEELDKMLSHTVVRDAIPSEYFDYDCVQRLVADVRSLVAEVARLTEETETRARQIKNMIKWLETNQSDVWSRGIWNALGEVKP